MFVIAVRKGLFLADFMKAMKAVGLPVRLPNLGISGGTWMKNAKELISKMLCFDPENRMKISDVCNKIQKIQGLCSKISVSMESFINSFLARKFCCRHPAHCNDIMSVILFCAFSQPTIRLSMKTMKDTLQQCVGYNKQVIEK